jgi:CMP-2-keto-3-deoxyoctulosonic acid synthetase
VRKHRHRKIKSPNLVTTCHEALGSERLDEAATLFNMTRAQYVALFVDGDSPLATEHAVFQAKKRACAIAVETGKAAKKDTPATPDE